MDTKDLQNSDSVQDEQKNANSEIQENTELDNSTDSMEQEVKVETENVVEKFEEIW